MSMMSTFDEIKLIIKACIIARKGGVPLNEINEEFSKNAGMDIPYLALGFTSLYDLMCNIHDIGTKRNDNDVVVYIVKNNHLSHHISYLVSRQRDSIKSYNKETSRRNKPYVRHRPHRSTINKHRIIGYFYNSEGETTDHTDEESHSPVIIESPPKDLTRIYGPCVNNHQLIGDDFFLQIAIRNLRQPIWRTKPCSPLHCGLLASGMTIKACRKALNKVITMSNKIVIMLGTEDIYRGRTGDQMIHDFEELLHVLHFCFAFSKNAVQLCTIPPLANLNMYDHQNQLAAHRKFNNYITELAEKENYGLIDFFQNMTNANWETQYEFFQLDARMVSGSCHPYVLLNKRGRKLAVNLLSTKN